MNKEYYLRKANQEWEMAALARQDGDKAGELKHIQNAKEYDRLAKEFD